MPKSTEEIISSVVVFFKTLGFDTCRHKNNNNVFFKHKTLDDTKF